MENASKAIIIVGGVALGVLLLAVMVYVFKQGSRVNEAYDQKQINNQLELYNSRFEKFNKDDNNIIDAISLANLAYNINNSCNYDPTLVVKVEIKVGKKVFTMPNVTKPNEKIVSGRNKILPESGSEMSIYGLATYVLYDSTPGVNNLGVTGLSGANNSDTLSTAKLKDGKTIYKYLFKVKNTDDFEYHVENGKVSKVKLTAYVNPEW